VLRCRHGLGLYFCQRGGGTLQGGQHIRYLVRREPQRRCLDGDAGVRAPAGPRHEHGHTEQARQELLVVQRVAAVVFHNRQWGAEKKNQVDFYNRRFVAGELDNQSFAGIARTMGAEGIVVDKLEAVGPALKKAIYMQINEGKTCIIEIICSRELGYPFRLDALSKPVRFLDKYKDYV